VLDRLDKKTYQTPGTGTNAARSQSNHLKQSPSKRNKKKKDTAGSENPFPTAVEINQRY